MKVMLIAAAVGLASLAGATGTAAQTPTAGGYYSGGAYYVPDGATTYWPRNNETAYYYGPYAYAPGYGPYLQLGGESGWDPNIGSTYNSYPPGNYYTDYGLPSFGAGYYAVPQVVRVYRGWPAFGVPAFIPRYGYWR